MLNKLLLNLVYLLLIGFTATVNASLVQYDYTGNAFDTFAGGGRPSDSHVEIKFVIDADLVPTTGHASFNFYASGNYRIDTWAIAIANINGIDSAPFWPYADRFSKSLSINFDTDSLKNIVSWNMSAASNYNAPLGSEYTLVSSIFDPSNAIATADSYGYTAGSFQDDGEGGYVFVESPYSYRATLQNTPGIWTKSSQITVPIPNAVPIPGAVWLFGSVVGGCLLTRRFSKS